MSWLYIFIGVIAFISGIILIWFLVRAWPQLTLLDAHKITKVKESSKKDEILRRRVAQAQATKEVKQTIFTAWLIDWWKRIQTQFRTQVDRLERLMLDERRGTKFVPLTDQEIGARNHQVKVLLRNAENAFADGAYETAEKIYIEVISLDEHNAVAYAGLGNVYFAEEHFTEARETYRYALRLDKNNETAWLHLADIAERDGHLEKAVEYYQKALLLNDSISSRFVKMYELLIQLNQPDTALAAIEQALALEPQNPKYLDNFITTSIIVGNKNQAEDGYQRLRMVNPENQKLSAFRDRIDALV